MFGKLLEGNDGQCVWLVSPAPQKPLSRIFHLLEERDDRKGALDPCTRNRENPTERGISFILRHLQALSFTPVNTIPSYWINL